MLPSQRELFYGDKAKSKLAREAVVNDEEENCKKIKYFDHYTVRTHNLGSNVSPR